MKYMSREGSCDISGCDEPIKARRLCAFHYQQTGRIVRECEYCFANFMGYGRQRWCTTCVPHDQARARMQRYGISEPEYLTMLKDQDSGCALCGEPKKLVVDHNPRTGHVRGLLCNLCNSHLHHFDHDPQWLIDAAAYVHKKEVVLDAEKEPTA